MSAPWHMAHRFRKILSPLLLSAKDKDDIESITISAAINFILNFIAP